jgi:EmrB/QacA subfamily drug resistance transporter
MSTTTASATTTDPPDPVARAEARRRTWILVAVCTGLIAVVASVSGLNVAQGQLAADLSATQSQLLWVINGYTIALAALLLPIGAIGDRWGRKQVLLAGLTIFSMANVAAALSSTVTQLLVARVVAGASAAMIMPVTLSVITSTFPEEDRDRAIGVWAGFAGAGGILGLLSSSIVVDNFTWPWVFLAPTVAALAALVMTVAVVPRSRDEQHGRFDTLGSFLSAFAVGGLVLAVHEGPEVGWSDPLTVFGLTVGILGAMWFAWWEMRVEHPLLDIRVFRNRSLATASVVLMVLFAMMMGLFLVIVQFLQAVLGYSAIKASLSLMPIAVVMMPLSTVAPRIASRVGYRAMFTIGTGLFATGLAMMASMASVSGGYWSVLPGFLVLGVGMGLAQTPATTAITASLPVEEQGVASALNDTVREFGGALGIALVGSILSAGYRSGLGSAPDVLPPEAAEAVRSGIGGASYVAQQAGSAGEQIMAVARGAFVDGLSQSLWVAAGITLLAGIAAFVWTPRQAHLADGTVAELEELEVLEHSIEDELAGQAAHLQPTPID